MAFYKIKHITRYSYSSPVIDCTNQIMLYPVIDSLLEVRKHEIRISNNPAVEIFADYFGNYTGMFSIIKPHSELLIESEVEVVTKPIIMPLDDTPAEDQWKFLEAITYQLEYMDFLTEEHSSSQEDIKNTLQELISHNLSPLQNGIQLSEYIYNNFVYQKGITSVETSIDEVWKLKAGVCQDFAHILLVLLRMVRIPAKYVSGYICPKDKEMRGEGATHAWVEAYIPHYGWLGLDPTNNCIVNDQHVRLAVGRNFSDCTPVKGTYKGSGQHILEVSVEIKNGSNIKSAEKQAQPKFSYQAKNPGEPLNSYRHYLEIQQKQQQQ